MLYGIGMGSRRSMITIATDAETKDRVRRYAEAAGVDVTTYVSSAIGAAMQRDDLVARAFAPLDAAIEEAEARDDELPWPPAGEPAPSQAERESLDRALNDFFQDSHGHQGAA